MIVLTLLQSSSSGGLANFTSSYNNVFSSKGTTNFLTKFTWVIVVLFFLNTMLLGKFYASNQRASIVDKIESSIDRLEENLENSDIKKDNDPQQKTDDIPQDLGDNISKNLENNAQE